MADIYIITNLVNGKYYVGKTVLSLQQRWYCHCSEARAGKGSLLHRAIRKYGEANFIIELLVSTHEDNLDILERFWISLLSSTNSDFGYNLTKGGEGGNTRKFLTQERKLEINKKISLGQKKRDLSTLMKRKWADPEYQLIQTHARAGWTFSENHKRNLSSGIKDSWILRREKFGQNGRRSKTA